MSCYECLAIYSPLDITRYLDVLQTEYGARPHPQQAYCFLIEEPSLPFYRPRQHGDHIAILGFNYAPLPGLLIHALINHPDLIAAETLVRWTAEQDLVVSGTLAELSRLIRRAA